MEPSMLCHVAVGQRACTVGTGAFASTQTSVKAYVPARVPPQGVSAGQDAEKVTAAETTSPITLRFIRRDAISVLPFVRWCCRAPGPSRSTNSAKDSGIRARMVKDDASPRTGEAPRTSGAEHLGRHATQTREV